MHDDGQPHWSDEVLSFLVRLGIDPHTWALNYAPEGGGRVIIALPESKIALAVDGDNPEPLEDDGWTIERMSVTGLQNFARVARSLSSSAFEHVRRVSASNMIKTGSQEEERLLAAILRSNLPEPDRNLSLRRDDGSELTVPDFAWPDLKVAFFMDGLWWHVGRDDDEKMKAIRNLAADEEQGEAVMEANRARAQRDAENRSDLTLMGWRWLSCTDADLEDDAGVRKQVEKIGRMLRSAAEERRAQDLPRPERTSDNRAQDILDLL